MRVPPAGSLSALPAVSLVKPTPLNEVLDSTREGLFTTLVPESSTKALSKYTDMVDNIIRTQAEKMQQGSEITRVKLKEMDLPDSILALEGNSGLPLDLKEDVEVVQISGGLSGLELELQHLQNLRRVNEELLVQTEELLQKEANEDEQFRTQFETRWTRPQSVNLTKSMLDRINRLAGNLKQAADSDSKIERAVKDNFELMSTLDRRPIESALPSLARPIMSLDGNEDAILGALKQSLENYDLFLGELLNTKGACCDQDKDIIDITNDFIPDYTKHTKDLINNLKKHTCICGKRSTVKLHYVCQDNVIVVTADAASWFYYNGDVPVIAISVQLEKRH